jgi:alkylation response protein AidB-like acyl-CoA dehydrogenase
MDFGLDDDQRMLADLAARFVEKEYAADPAQRQREPESFSRARWSILAETGLLGLNVPEAQGGLGATAAETLIVMEAFGRGLVEEPYLASAVTSARLLTFAGTPDQQAEILPALAAGERLVALAALEPGGRYDLWQVSTSAKTDGTGWVLDGRKTGVFQGDTADTLIVSARRDGMPGEDGIGLFLVDASAPGVTIEGAPSFDDGRIATVHLEDVRVGADSRLAGGYAALEHAVDYALAGLSAEAVGAMQRLLDLTADYLRVRQQFGRPIGSFQALQHKAAEMVASVEQARSMALLAAARVGEPDRRLRRRALSAAKSLVGRCARHVGQTAIQLHGGMGMTEEMACSHYFKRLTAIDKSWGDAAHHEDLVAELG